MSTVRTSRGWRIGPAPVLLGVLVLALATLVVALGNHRTGREPERGRALGAARRPGGARPVRRPDRRLAGAGRLGGRIVRAPAGRSRSEGDGELTGVRRTMARYAAIAAVVWFGVRAGRARLHHRRDRRRPAGHAGLRRHRGLHRHPARPRPRPGGQPGAGGGGGQPGHPGHPGDHDRLRRGVLAAGRAPARPGRARRRDPGPHERRGQPRPAPAGRDVVGRRPGGAAAGGSPAR